MSDADTELDAAVAALAAADEERALEHLVAAWGHCRADALVPLVDALANRIEPREKPLGGKTSAERFDAFRTTATRRRQADLGRLVAMLPKLAYNDLGAAFDILRRWPPTPRLRMLLEPVRLMGYADRVHELRRASLPQPSSFSPRARVAIAELERALGGDPAGTELLAQVYNDPDADAPRLVYADWASSRGDPHGELIALQFARRERAPDQTAVRRERQLIEQFAARWLAPIWNAIRSYRFERGFLACVTVEPFAVIAPRPEWATVVALELAYHDALPIEVFRALRELRNVTPKLLAQIAPRAQRLVHLGLADEPGTTTVRRMPLLAEAARFPALRSLGVWGHPEDWTWLWGMPIAAQLVALEVRHQTPRDWLVAPLPRAIRELRLHDQTGDVRFLRGDDDAFDRLAVTSRDPTALLHVLGLPPGLLREVRVIVPRKPKVDLERETRALHPALARFTLDVDPFV